MILGRFAAALALGTTIPLVTAAQQSGVDSAVQLYGRHDYAAAAEVLSPASLAGDPGVYFWLGRIALAQYNADDAVRWLEKAVRANDSSSEYHLWLGRAYGTKAEHASLFKRPSLAKRTKAEFEQALALDPQNIDARVDLITYLVEAPGFLGGSHDRAKAMARELRTLNPYRGALAAGTIAESEGNPAGAQAEYRTLMQSYPDSAEPVMRIASRYQHDRRWDDALALVDSFLARRPNDPDPLYHLGAIAALSGQRLDAGAEALERYLAIPVSEDLPSYADAHYRLGMIQERRGDTAAARTEYQAAIALNPELKDARRALDRLR
jgi:tetratricopeptide (TPR) repeat protein